MHFLKTMGVLVTVLGVACSTKTKTQDPAPLIDEHPGQTFNNGTPVGYVRNISGSKLTLGVFGVSYFGTHHPGMRANVPK